MDFLPSKYEKKYENGCPKKSFHKTFEHSLWFFYRSLFKRKYFFLKLDIDLSPLKTMFTLCLQFISAVHFHKIHVLIGWINLFSHDVCSCSLIPGCHHLLGSGVWFTLDPGLLLLHLDLSSASTIPRNQVF